MINPVLSVGCADKKKYRKKRKNPVATTTAAHGATHTVLQKQGKKINILWFVLNASLPSRIVYVLYQNLYFTIALFMWNSMYYEYDILWEANA